MRNVLSWSFLASISLVFGAVIPRQADTQQNIDPCAQLIAYYNEFYSPGDSATVPNAALDAQQCLLSIPFDQELASSYLSEVSKYVQFQSTLEILKSPPSSYISKAVDIIGDLQAISDKVQNNQYSSQYDFESDILLVFKSANDGHFYIGTCTTSIFKFSRGSYQLLSMSPDGVSLPQLYLAYNNTPVGGDTPSPVATINGQDATEYINVLAGLQSSQDPDARFNSLFPSYASFAGSEAQSTLYGAFSSDSDSLWPGTNLTLVCLEDGSVVEVPTVVSFSFKDTEGIVDGQSLFKSQCIPSPTTGDAPSNTSSVETSVPTDVPPETEPEPTAPETTADPPPTYTLGPVGYPSPVYLDGYNNFAGYYLDDETAVLFIPTFEIKPETSQTETGKVSNLEAEFISAAISSGHSKLIIDLSGNGGGTIALAWNLFRLFFPTEFPYSATRFRRHPAVDLLTDVLGAANLTVAEDIPNLLEASIPNYPYQQVRPDQASPVTSASDLLGDDIVQYGVPLSSLYANFNYTLKSLFNTEPIRGFGEVPLNFTSPPYRSEDILILTDGSCASTCTTFTNLMTNVGNVSTIAFGGRAQYGPMQIMGGVRGSQAIQADKIAKGFDIAGEIIQAGYYSLSDEEYKVANETLPKALAEWPVIVSTFGLNLRNAYQEGNDELPLQFQYQAADCRLFYTYENYVQPASQWRDAAKAVWGGGSCVEQSQGGYGSVAWRQANSTGGSGWTDYQGGEAADGVKDVAKAEVYVQCMAEVESIIGEKRGADGEVPDGDDKAKKKSK